MPRNEFICDCNVVDEERVAAAKASLPEKNMLDRVSDFYKLMGDRTRCTILYALKQGEMCVCDLANVLSMSKSSVSHQLAKMREAAMVKFRREGKVVYYSLDDEHISQFLEISMNHISHSLR